MSSSFSILTGGLSGQWTMPLLSGTETSIHPPFVVFALWDSLDNTQLPPLSERPAEVVGGADERQVREGLREVAQGLAAGSDLLRVEAEVVGVAEHLLEDEPGFFQPPRARERLDKPERAQVERTFLAHESVR